MAAHQGHGAHAQAHAAVQIEDAGHTHTHQVLYGDHDGGQQQEDQYRQRTLLQQLDTGTEAHAGEEEVHKGILQGLVELQSQDPGLIGDQVQDGKNQSTHHRGRDAATIQKVNVIDNETSQEEQQHRQGRCLQHIHLDRQHKFSLSSSLVFSRSAAVLYCVLHFMHQLQFPSNFYNANFISHTFHNSRHSFLNILTTPLIKALFLAIFYLFMKKGQDFQPKFTAS